MYNTPMLLIKLRRVFGLLLLVISLVVLIWGLRSPEYMLQATELAPSDLFFQESNQPTANGPARGAAVQSPGSRLLELSWPKSLRLGDEGTVRLTVRVLSSEPTASQASSETAEPVQPGMDNAYHFVLQSHLDLPGMAHTPTGEVSQAMLPDQPVVFLWYLRPASSGIFNGKVWLHLRFIPPSPAQEQRILLAAQQVDIQVTSLLGMSGSQARLAGSLGLVVGSFLALDGLLSWYLGVLAKRKS
jgi:hypothetical protein